MRQKMANFEIKKKIRRKRQTEKKTVGEGSPKPWEHGKKISLIGHFLRRRYNAF